MCCFQVNICLLNNAMDCGEWMVWFLEAKQSHLQVIGTPGQITYPFSGFEAIFFETGLYPSLGMCCTWHAVSDSSMCSHTGWVANMKGNDTDFSCTLNCFYFTCHRLAQSH